MNFRRVFCAKQLVARRFFYQPKVRHFLVSERHCLAGIRPEFEIRPKRATQEHEAIKHECLVIQHMNIAAIGFALERVDQIRDGMVVKFMVSRNINDRTVTEILFCPFYTGGAYMNIACQHNDISIFACRLKLAKFEMQIA